MKRLCLLMALMLAGCSVTDKSGTKHTVIIGFGIVSVNLTNGAAGVYKTQLLGVGVSDMPGVRLGVGYANSVTVCATSNVVIEVSDSPGSPMKVSSP